MGIKKIKTLTLYEALRQMEVGETCAAPEGTGKSYVKRACSGLKSEGYLFATSQRTGEITITRLR